MFCMPNKKKIYLAYVSKYNLNYEKQVFPLMIPNREGWYYLAVKNLSALLRGISSKNHDDFFCLDCLHSFRTKNKLELHKKLCESKNFWNIIMPFQDTKILEVNQYQKSDEAPFVIYADLECLIERIDICKNNHQNPFRDHCHYTGECRRVAHSICNLKYGVPKKIHIAFHNGCN